MLSRQYFVRTPRTVFVAISSCLGSSVEDKVLFLRNFELVKKHESNEKKEKAKKRSKKEELSFLKNSSKKRREDDRPKIVKTKEDERWKFGVSHLIRQLTCYVRSQYKS